MKRFTPIGASVLAVLALGTMGAATAQAISPAPYFTIGGTRLVAGKTHNITGRLSKAFDLNVPEEGVKIECEELGGGTGTISGSSEGEPGKARGTAGFGQCALDEGNGEPNCALSEETLTTNTLVAEQVESVSGGGGGKQLLTEIFPASGSNFMTLHFSGTSCTTKETIVSGQVVGEDVTDNAAEEKIELGGTAKEATSWRLRFPSASIKEIWLITNGVGKIAKAKLVSFGDASNLLGTSLIGLANAALEVEEVLWSPLP